MSAKVSVNSLRRQVCSYRKDAISCGSEFIREEGGAFSQNTELYSPNSTCTDLIRVYCASELIPFSRPTPDCL
ncbi:MAG: hypothetical protein JWP80_2080 [Pseudomonas sp.]|nr:hypothetical protein [Pseudomonas sp.]